MSEEEYVMSEIEKRCRFVFNHKAWRVGITADPAVVADARAEGMRVVEYERTRSGPTEWEIMLGPERR